MNKDVIAVKLSIPLEWSYVEWSVASAIANAVDGKEKITVEIMDVRNAYQMTQKTIYIGDRTFEPVEFTTDGKVYWNISFSEIEV